MPDNLHNNNNSLYCEEKAAPTGSAVYYSFLYTEKNRRERLLALRALSQALASIELECHDNALAQQKCHFWEEEFFKLETGNPTHPITKILAKNAQIDQNFIQTVTTALKAHYQHLLTPVYQTETARLTFYKKTAGALETLFLEPYNPANNHNVDILEKLGIFIAMSYRLCHTRALLIRGRSSVTAEALIAHQVTLQQLAKIKINPSIQQLFQHETETSLRIYQEALQLLTLVKNKKKESGVLLPSLILAKIQAALLEEIKKANFPLLTQQIQLTPLRKWWIAWRVYRKMQRN